MILDVIFCLVIDISSMSLSKFGYYELRGPPGHRGVQGVPGISSLSVVNPVVGGVAVFGTTSTTSPQLQTPTATVTSPQPLSVTGNISSTATISAPTVSATTALSGPSVTASTTFTGPSCSSTSTGTSVSKPLTVSTGSNPLSVTASTSVSSNNTSVATFTGTATASRSVLNLVNGNTGAGSISAAIYFGASSTGTSKTWEVGNDHLAAGTDEFYIRSQTAANSVLTIAPNGSMVQTGTNQSGVYSTLTLQANNTARNYLRLYNTHGSVNTSSIANGITFGPSSGQGQWEFGNDANGSGQDNFYIFSSTAGNQVQLWATNLCTIKTPLIVTGITTTNGVMLPTQSSNPGSTNTLWSSSTDTTHPYFGANQVAIASDIPTTGFFTPTATFSGNPGQTVTTAPSVYMSKSARNILMNVTGAVINCTNASYVGNFTWTVPIPAGCTPYYGETVQAVQMTMPGSTGTGGGFASMTLAWAFLTVSGSNLQIVVEMDPSVTPGTGTYQLFPFTLPYVSQ